MLTPQCHLPSVPTLTLLQKYIYIYFGTYSLAWPPPLATTHHHVNPPPPPPPPSSFVSPDTPFGPTPPPEASTPPGATFSTNVSLVTWVRPLSENTLTI